LFLHPFRHFSTEAEIHMDTHDDPHRSAPHLTLAEVAEMVGGRVEGDSSIPVSGIAPLDQANPEELGFLAQRRYLRFLPGSRALAVLVSESLAEGAKGVPGRVVVEDPHGALPRLLAHFHPQRPVEPGIHPTAVLGRGVVLGEEVTIGPYAVLEDGVTLGARVQVGSHAVLGCGSVVGEDSHLHPHVVLYPGTRVGSRVILHAGVRLGVDGFGYFTEEGRHRKIPQVGACVVGDDVEIGANTCIDRGSIGRTVVGAGTKLDNLIHLAHNVLVGRGVLMAAMVGVSGSTRVGDGAMLGGQAGIIGHAEIGTGARIGAQAGVIGDIAPGETVSGYPARNNREYLRAMGLTFKLPSAFRRLEELERRLMALEEGDEA
jgi:UDP-3-O-[3-hydroxymyristoyl] glucosamine N-acyltransferase